MRVLYTAFIIGTIAIGVMQIFKNELMFGANGTRNESFGIASNEYIPAKPSDVLGSALEYIVVFDPSKQIEEFFSCLDIQNVLWGDSAQGKQWGQSSTDSKIGRDDSFCGTGARGNMVKIKIIGNRVIAKDTLGICNHVFSGRISAVIPIRSKAPIPHFCFSIFFVKLLEPTTVNECPLIGNQSVFSECGLLMRNDSKKDSKNSDYYCSQSGYSPIVLVNDTQRASDLDGERFFYFGIIFIFLLIIICAFLIV